MVAFLSINNKTIDWIDRMIVRDMVRMLKRIDTRNSIRIMRQCRGLIIIV